MAKVLTQSQIDQFVELGYYVLREAFPASIAAEAREFLWAKSGVDPQKPETWTKNVVHIKETYNCHPFDKVYTPRLRGALDDVMGEGRYNDASGMGWWPISFPGFEQPPWTEPTTGWHVDGQQFHHHLNSRDQGLLPIFIFSDIGPGDGGTALAERSHITTAKILAEHNEKGLTVGELKDLVNQHPRGKVVESNGRAGDVVLLHPFMAHARSANTGQRVRFICNPCFSLKEEMNLNRADPGQYSPVERAIVEALRQTVR